MRYIYYVIVRKSLYSVEEGEEFCVFCNKLKTTIAFSFRKRVRKHRFSICVRTTDCVKFSQFVPKCHSKFMRFNFQ